MKYLKNFRLFENTDSNLELQDVIDGGREQLIFFNIYRSVREKEPDIDEVINKVANMTEEQLIQNYQISTKEANSLFTFFKKMKEKKLGAAKKKTDLENYAKEVRKWDSTPGEDFPNTKVTKTLWRAGEIKFDPLSGGTWFAVKKWDAEAFALSVRSQKREAKAYYVNLQKPFEFDSFWYGYLKDVEKRGDRLSDELEKEYRKYNRLELMKELEEAGYDGIIIGEDTWNDTGNPDTMVRSEQYIVFDPKNIRLAEDYLPEI